MPSLQRPGGQQIDTLPDLSDRELIDLVRRVFAPRPGDDKLALLVDLPDGEIADSEEWRDRRHLAATWLRRLDAAQAETGLRCHLFAYGNVRANNADLPATAWRIDGELPTDAAAAAELEATPFLHLFEHYPIFIALSQFSATAPLKLTAARHGFRAATMPGFNRSMINALRLDYVEVDRRVRALAKRLDEASAAHFRFSVAGQVHRLSLDLRHRRAHPSGGLVQEPGKAGNLPSGEAYIVPYEGEIAGDVSRSNGVLPVQLDDEVVLYRIVENRAVDILNQGPQADAERRHLLAEPAYGNMAELGLGVLGDFGVEPVGRILLDEKLGLHIAFGRSDHFGGQVGAAQFSHPQAVVHIDRVYLAQTQPKVHVDRVDLEAAEGEVPLMRHGKYV